MALKKWGTVGRDKLAKKKYTHLNLLVPKTPYAIGLSFSSLRNEGKIWHGEWLAHYWIETGALELRAVLDMNGCCWFLQWRKNWLNINNNNMHIGILQEVLVVEKILHHGLVTNIILVAILHKCKNVVFTQEKSWGWMEKEKSKKEKERETRKRKEQVLCLAVSPRLILPPQEWRKIALDERSGKLFGVVILGRISQNFLFHVIFRFPASLAEVSWHERTVLNYMLHVSPLSSPSSTVR